jgi:Putative lumazine-binding
MKKMKKIIALLIIVIGFVNTAFTQSLQEEIDAVKTVCHYYIDGGTNGDSVTFSKAFSATGLMQYMRNDTLKIVSLKDFMAGMKNSGKKQERQSKIESVEVYGNAAVAKITFEYPTFYFHDIMSLLKTKDGWKIVSKIFYREMKK